MKKVVLTGLLIGCASMLTPAADPPQTINYQGVLRHASEKPVPDGAYDMVFRFFDDLDPSPPENEILVESRSVQVSGGLFNVRLGENVADGDGSGEYGSLARAFGEFSSLHLQVEVGGETLAPRIPVSAAGYALNARRVRGREIISDGPIDLYVDDDTCPAPGSGSPTDPYCSIQTAIDELPPILSGDATVHIADGTYPGEIRIAGIRSRGEHTVVLQGSAGTVISGGGTQERGIWAEKISSLALANLQVREFTGIGVQVLETWASIRSCDISQNGHHGLAMGMAYTAIQDSSISLNGANGIDCSMGAGLDLRESEPTENVTIAQNGWAGIWADQCKVRFNGPVIIRDNGSNGATAGPSGEIEVGNRSDVSFFGHDFGCDLKADVHGYVHGYANASLGSMCTCGEMVGGGGAKHGYCEPIAQ